LLANGNIKVMDFGIARFARNESQTMTDKAIGSVHYISPEQAKGDVTDLKADIYSVGVMMYEMLSGRLPFDGESPVGVAIKQISDAPTPLRQINPAVPEALQAITERAMAKEPRERYQSAGAMLADIEAFKRNPSIKFEYQYLTSSMPTRYMDRAVSKTPQRRPEQSRRPSSAAAPKRPAASGNRTRRTGSRSSLFKKKWLWPVMAGASLAFFLVSLLSCYFILKNTVLFAKAKDLELPNFAKMQRSEVEKSPQFKEFTNIEFEEVADADVPAGTIVSQTPKPPKTVKSTARIILRVSIGITQVSVPDIVGKDQATGLQAMKDAGLNVMLKRREVENKTDPFGNVLELTLTDGTPVKAGQVMDSGTTILVYVSAEHRDDEVRVPQCVGLASKEEALTLLASRDLSIGSITEEDSTAPAGSIIRQSPEYVETTDPKDKAGMVKKGSLIDLVISKGHTHTYVETARTEPQGCETPGSITYTCSVCGDARTEPIPAHGHDWGEWTLTTPPTTTADGVETRTCKRDANHTEKRAVPKLPPASSGGSSGGSSSGA
ncbi:MAG: PASTA domain-containing protein, partial [Ruthenibacterium sp.]